MSNEVNDFLSLMFEDSLMKKTHYYFFDILDHFEEWGRDLAFQPTCFPLFYENIRFVPIKYSNTILLFCINDMDVYICNVINLKEIWIK